MPTATVSSPSDGLLTMAQLSRAADCLKKMAHPVRLRIVDLLMRGDYSVGELATACDLPEHQACAHLRLLQACGLLTSERQGREVHYRIASPQLPALLECVRANCTATPETGATR